MKLHHRAFLTVNQQTFESLKKLQLEMEAERHHTGLLRLESDDDNPDWPRAKALILKSGDPAIFTHTYFSASDFQGASYMQFTANEKWTLSLPPQKDSAKDPLGRSGGCPVCAVGFVQTASMSFSKPVKWGRDSFFMISGLWDEVFVTTAAWEAIFKPFGIGFRPVLLHPTGEAMPDIVQLLCEEVVDLDLHPTEAYEDCAVCGQRRYDIHNIGFMPCPKTDPKTHLFKSAQWFGTGHNARRQLTITKELYEAIKASKLRGAWFRPCGPQMPQWKQPLTAENAQ